MNDNYTKGRAERNLLIRRFAALLIDFLILSLYAGVLFVLSPILSPLFQETAWKSEFFGFVLLVMPVFLYFFLFEASRFKATPGKLCLHLKVVALDGTDFSYKNSFVRSLVKFIPWETAHFALWQFMFPDSMFSSIAITLLVVTNFLGILYIVFPFFNSKKRAIHDFAAQSVLIMR